MRTLSTEAKLLRHVDRVQGAVSGEYKPPVMVDVDPVNGVCNLDCEWCCQAASRHSAKAPTVMPDATMVRLGRFSREFGIKAWRISSDSEPLLNKNLDILIRSGHENGIDMGLITNGVLLERSQELHRLRWVGVSLDAATAATWSRLKRSHESNFHKILDNVRRIRKTWPSLEVTLKFLRWRDDSSLAKNEFSTNDLPIIDREKPQQTDNYLDADLLPDLANRLDCKYLIKDAYPKDFANHYRFNKCLATPLGGVFGADHRFHLCCDARGVYILTDDYTRDDWQELPRLWGSDTHRKLVDSIAGKNCAGCAKHLVNEILESVVLDGPQTEQAQVNFI